MEIISPVTAESCNSYIGKPVCAVLQDGSRVYGYLHGVESGKLLLRLNPESADVSSAKRKKGKQAARTNAFYPYAPYGFYAPGILALELALIALLFAVPFFW